MRNRTKTERKHSLTSRSRDLNVLTAATAGLVDHLKELRRQTLKLLIGIAVGMAICLTDPAELVGLAHLTGQAQAATGFRVSGSNLLDANGNNFVMRGINHPHTWYPTKTSSFSDIKTAGANTVRVVLASGQRWPPNSASDVTNVIQLCKSNRLICVLEVHDTTGFGEQNGAATLSQAVSYWRQIQNVLAGQEAYMIINIGNEPYGNNNTANWVNDTSNAIAQMRSAGFRHTLMVDAPNWGQDWQFIMRDNAASIFNSDPDRNTIFSIHMYGVFDTTSKVQSYISTFVNNGLPLVIGEFGHLSPDGNPDEDAIMAQAQANGIGYFAWSWSGNGGGVEYLDMVTNFDPTKVTSWGNRVINGANGLRQTSQEAMVDFSDPTVVAAVLPSSRSVQVGNPATAFATIINVSSSLAVGCGLSLLTSLPATFTFQTTDRTTNQVNGTANTPVDIPAGAAQSFVLALTPTGAISPTDVALRFGCTNSSPAPSTSGLNTLLFSAATTPVPDIVALAATLTNDGIVKIPGTTGTGVFSVATVNVGSSGTLTATADTGSVTLSLSLTLCQTNPTTGACLASPASSVPTQISANATPTFGIFVAGSGPVPFDPAQNRLIVRFTDAGGVVRGATSVAVRTQ